MSIPRATIDFETRSAAPLRKTGSWRYSLDPTTEILCLAFRLPYWKAGRTSLWHPAFPHLDIPEADNNDDVQELLEWISDGGLIEAHNAWFERGIWTNILVTQFGWPTVPTDQWRCSAAQAAAHALPRGLGDACSVLKLPIAKDAEGHTLMKKVSKPRKARKAEKAAGVTSLLWWESRELFERLWEYCRTDVLAEEALSDAIPDLTPAETEMYLLDQTINQRGFQLDDEAVDIALELIKQETAVLTKELVKVTRGKVAKATQRAQMLRWFASEGLDLEDTQKTTLDEVVLDPLLTPKVRRGLELVRTLGRSSTAKYQSMANWRCPDGRVRGGLLYHGAGTGRWSGAGVQPHNFVKGSESRMGLLWDVLRTRNRDTIRLVCGDVMEALANGLRGAIVAAPGYQLYVADYAAIEARVVLWLAGDEDALGIFRRHEDIYKDMAADIYAVAMEEVSGDQRQHGKQAVLGCLAADTLVLTPRGWIDIVSITKQDLVWDGGVWVSHDGMIERGVKETTCLNGLRLTPDHMIRAGSQWREASDVEHSAPANTLALETGAANLPFWALFGVPETGLPGSWLDAPVDDHPTRSRMVTGTKELLRGVRSALGRKQGIGENTIGDMRISSQTLPTGPACLTESVPSSIAAKTRIVPTMGIMVEEESESIQLGWSALRGVGSFLNTLSRWKDGTNPILTWIAQKMIAGINREIFVSLHDLSTPSTSEASKSCSAKSSNWRPVYDLVNAGPHQRFTVLSNRGPLLVHNCGYQMGWSKFQATCAKYGIIIDDATAQRIVEAYRAKYWRVVEMWGTQEHAAMMTVRTGKPHRAGYVTWLIEGKFLYCELPSGRRLSYPFPEIRERETPWGATRAALTFMGINPYTRKWERQSTYGGSLVENITQAVSRDIMAEAMLRCERSGTYVPVLSIHDECVAEAKLGTGDVAEYGQLIAHCPVWATGLPIAVEGWRGLRYRK